MNQQSLRALIVLLASFPLLAALSARPNIERLSTQAVAKRSDHWRSSLRLDISGRDQDIVIPSVPPPDPSHSWLYGGSSESGDHLEPGYFDNNQPVQQRRPVVLLSCELPDDYDVLTPALDDIVIPPVPPPKTTAQLSKDEWKRYTKAVLGDGMRELVPRPMPQSEKSPCSICGKYH